MKTRFIVALFAALSASVTVPAFASGYGPAPSYRPAVGAPASQRGQSVQTLAAENAANADSAAQTSVTQAAYGGSVAGRSESGGRVFATPRDNLFAHH
jgi:hypothetical protein